MGKEPESKLGKNTISVLFLIGFGMVYLGLAMLMGFLAATIAALLVVGLFLMIFAIDQA